MGQMSIGHRVCNTFPVVIKKKKKLKKKIVVMITDSAVRSEANLRPTGVVLI